MANFMSFVIRAVNSFMFCYIYKSFPHVYLFLKQTQKHYTTMVFIGPNTVKAIPIDTTRKIGSPNGQKRRQKIGHRERHQFSTPYKGVGSYLLTPNNISYASGDVQNS